MSIDRGFFGIGSECCGRGGSRRRPAFGSNTVCSLVSGEPSEGRVLIFDLADIVTFDGISATSLGVEACGIEVRYGAVGNFSEALFWTIFM